MVSSLGNQGKALLNLGRLEEALVCYDKSIQITECIYQEKGYEYAVCNLNSARVLLAMGNKKEALKRCDIAKEVLNREKVKSEDRAADALKSCINLRKEILEQ